MACEGPFKNGIAGDPVCGCSCADSKCCPPPCCTSVSLFFELGPAYDEIDYPEGCKCEDPTPPEEPAPLLRELSEKENWETINIGSHLIPFPKFKKKSNKNLDNYVFALGGSCSLPCEVLEIQLTVDSCCIEIVDGTEGQTNFNPDVSLRMVGDGLVFATYNAGDCEFDLVINGTTITEEEDSVFVADGDPIVVSLEPKGKNADCCTPCWIDTQCTPSSILATKVFFRARSVKKGAKGYLNIAKLMERINRLKRRKS